MSQSHKTPFILAHPSLAVFTKGYEARRRRERRERAMNFLLQKRRACTDEMGRDAE